MMNHQAQRITSESFRKGPKLFTGGVIGAGDLIEDEFGSVSNWHAYLCAVGALRFQYKSAKTKPERWNAIRAYYSFIQPEIDSAPATKWANDPYEISFDSDYTPIERDAWCCIRIHGLVMYPQYPALGFFLDFANPKLKLAIEMDGKQWHDAAKDAARDSKLAANGWTVYRIPGGHCSRQLPNSDELYEKYRENLDAPEYRRGMRDWYTKTVEGVITAIGCAYFEGRNYLDHEHCDFIDEALYLHCTAGGIQHDDD